MEPKYPGITVELVGTDSNAFSIRRTLIVAAMAAPLLAAGPSGAGEELGRFMGCWFDEMRPMGSRGPTTDLYRYEPASLIAVRALQVCQEDGHATPVGVERWRAIDMAVEWIFNVRSEAHEHALRVCGERCSQQVWDQAEAEALARLAYQRGD
jgi:hypothetical protein